MIEANFYDLHDDPFSNTAHPAWLFASRGSKAALQALVASLKARQSCVMLLGEAGVGKTFLAHAALAHRDLRHLKTVHLWYPLSSFHDTLQMIGWEFGLDTVTFDAAKLAQALHRALLTEHERGRQVVLVIDEAHTIAVESLEILLRLSNIRVLTEAPLLQILLVGLPTLWHHFSAPPLRPFKPPRVTRVMLAPLTYGERLAYIRHRLQHAGAEAGADTVFASGAVQAVARRAGGNPRIINVLCMHILISGFLARQRPISARIAQDAIAAYGAKRSHRRWGAVTAAASLLVVGALVGLFPSTYPSVTEHGPRGLLQLTRRLLTGSSGEIAQQPAALGASPAVPSLMVPHQQRDPAPQARVESALDSMVGQDAGEGASYLVPSEVLESQHLEPPPESAPDSVIGQDAGEGASYLVPSEVLENQHLDPPAVTLTPSVTPTSPAPSPPATTPIRRAFKACDELKAEIQAKLDAKKITGYTLTIMASWDLTGHHIVGSCEGNTKKIVYTRSRNAP
jgi:type II secretory pathway predicted ATPase ExeA